LRAIPIQAESKVKALKSPAYQSSIFGLRAARSTRLKPTPPQKIKFCAVSARIA